MDARLNNSSLLDDSRVMNQSRDTENNVASGEYEVKQTYGEYEVK
jgi:hypothetical protein